MNNIDYIMYKKSSKMVRVDFISYKEVNIFEKITCINNLNFKTGDLDYTYKGKNFVGNIKDFILRKFIGLKDKNGKKIYCGDIVEYEDGEESYIGVIKEDSYYFYIHGVAPNENFQLEDVSNTLTGTAELTVRGNEFENKEWLRTISERYLNAI